jgi:hypothetical protein
MIILQIEITDIESVIAQYDHLHVYSDTSPVGSFTTLAASIVLNASQNVYVYEDPSTLVPLWYQTTFYDSITDTESARRDPFQGILSLGPLKLLTIDYVRAMTDFPVIQALPDAKIGELIVRSESMLQRFADRNGGWNASYPNFSLLSRMLARLLLEEIWVRSSPTLRVAQASGYTMERQGTYEYRRVAAKVPAASVSTSLADYFSPENMDVLRVLVNLSPTRVFVQTTSVFRQMHSHPNRDGIEVRPWWDGVDEELWWDNWGTLVRIREHEGIPVPHRGIPDPFDGGSL